MPPLSDAQRQALTREALRLNDRYLHEVIEGNNFCPYARSARRESRMSRYVWLEPIEPPDGLLTLMSEIAADPGQEVSQVIFPLVDMAPWPWRTFVKNLDDLLTSSPTLSRFKTTLASAAFHPTADFDPRTPAALVPLFRRAPDPTIQWTRLDVLDAVTESSGESSHYVDLNGLSVEQILARLDAIRPPLSERIAAANHASAHKLGVEAVTRALADIAEDRRATYAALLG